MLIRSRVYAKVKAALISGELVRSDTCDMCHQTFDYNYNTTVAHHPDYSKPLLIMWLCRSCHFKLHRSIKPFSPRRMTPKLERYFEALRLTKEGNYGRNFWKEYNKILGALT